LIVPKFADFLETSIYNYYYYYYYY